MARPPRPLVVACGSSPSCHVPARARGSSPAVGAPEPRSASLVGPTPALPLPPDGLGRRRPLRAVAVAVAAGTDHACAAAGRQHRQVLGPERMSVPARRRHTHRPPHAGRRLRASAAGDGRLGRHGPVPAPCFRRHRAAAGAASPAAEPPRHQPDRVDCPRPQRRRSGLGRPAAHACACLSGGLHDSAGAPTRTASSATAAPVTARRRWPSPGISDATAVSAGGITPAPSSSDGGVKCWGLNRSVSVGDGASRRPSGSCGGFRHQRRRPPSRLAAVTPAPCCRTAACECWGWDSYGQLGDGSANYVRQAPWRSRASATPRAISAGELHTCALLADGDREVLGVRRVRRARRWHHRRACRAITGRRPRRRRRHLGRGRRHLRAPARRLRAVLGRRLHGPARRRHERRPLDSVAVRF